MLAPLAGRIYDHAPQQNAFPLESRTLVMHQPDKPSLFTAGPSSAIGHDGERRAITMTRELLEDRGFAVSLKSSQDSRGEDGRFSIRGTNYNVQVTSIPDAHDFWRAAKQGSATTEATPQQAAAWLEQGIQKKARGMSNEQRANTILILDAHDWGDRLATAETVRYLSTSTANPAEKHGFAGLSIAGNSLSNSTWLSGKLR